MNVQTCPKNIRCDSALCNNFASICINTSSHKGNINLCEDCFSKLFRAMQEMKKQITKIYEGRNEKRKIKS